MGVRCLFWCEGDNTPTYNEVHNYVNDKEVKKVQ